MALTITLKETSAGEVIAYNGSAAPLGERSDYAQLLKIAYESSREDYLALFEDPLPSYEDVLDELGEEGSLPADGLEFLTVPPLEAGKFLSNNGDHLSWETPSGSGSAPLTLTVGTAGASITNSSLANRDVNVVVINSSGAQNTGFTKVFSSNTLTFTDGTTVSVGDKVTFI
jgi:hypothetical protein